MKLNFLKNKNSRLIIILLIIIVFFLLFWKLGLGAKLSNLVNKKDNESERELVVCNDDIIKRYEILKMPVENRVELIQKEIDVISKLNYHTDDVNCLYIMSQYYPEIYNYSAAMQYADMLSEKLTENKKLSKLFTDVFTPDEIKNYLSFRMLAN